MELLMLTITLLITTLYQLHYFDLTVPEVNKRDQCCVPNLKILKPEAARLR
jgi:hypothetical protein